MISVLRALPGAVRALLALPDTERRVAALERQTAELQAIADELYIGEPATTGSRER